MAKISDTKTAFAAEGTLAGSAGFHTFRLCKTMRGTPPGPVTAPADGAQVGARVDAGVDARAGAFTRLRTDTRNALRLFAQEGGRHA